MLLGKVFGKVKDLVIGRRKDPLDKRIFHRISLIAFFAWVGLGADGVSSSCYGPESAFLALHGHNYLGIFVALGTVLTVFLISASYSQIIELFPSGGGGYLVASKLLSPGAGMFSGCALIIDYVLTIAISIACCMDAVFSLLPAGWLIFKFGTIICGVILLTIMNMRGVKDSVIPLVPIFLIFILTHVFAILYAFFTHLIEIPVLIEATRLQSHQVVSQTGVLGLIFLLLRSYSLGAGTYTGIEAVSNGLPILRDPKVETGKKTMRYMAISLSFIVFGLMLAYLLFNVAPQSGKTLNAILFENLTRDWGKIGSMFLIIALVSEGLILFVAAQTGFLDGPRVIASMAHDHWMPNKFINLSDRLVTQNGVLFMSVAALFTVFLSKGSVQFLVILYSINVFITFSFSQLGMVRHWWSVRSGVSSWFRKIMINGTGLIFTISILISVIVIKFHEGGWITLLITGSLTVFALLIKRHYNRVLKLLRRLDSLVEAARVTLPHKQGAQTTFDKTAKTAVLLVNGFNGLGLHTLFNVIRNFGNEFKNFVFIELGVLDAGNFKGAAEVSNLEEEVRKDLERYVAFMNSQGAFAEGLPCFGVDVISGIEKLIPIIEKRFPASVVFAGQLVFPEESIFTRWLHNNTVFALQREFYRQGIPFVLLPIRV